MANLSSAGGGLWITLADNRLVMPRRCGIVPSFMATGSPLFGLIFGFGCGLSVPVNPGPQTPLAMKHRVAGAGKLPGQRARGARLEGSFPLLNLTVGPQDIGLSLAAGENMAIQERPLTQNELKEFADYTDRAMINLGLANSQAAPEAVIQAVETFVDRWQAERRNPLKKLLSRTPDATDVALGLGSVWGNQLVRQFHWEWTCVKQNGQDLYAVVSPDRSIAVYPTYFIKACLDNPRVDCTIMLAFNMLTAGKVSGLPAQGYENLMQGVRRIVPKH